MNLLDMCGLAIPVGFVDIEKAAAAENCNKAENNNNVAAVHMPFGVTISAPAFNDDLLASFGDSVQKHIKLPLGNRGGEYFVSAR